MRLLSVLFIFSIALYGCSKNDQQALESGGTATKTVADIVFTGGKVYTVNEAQPWAEAVAISGNMLLYVGDSSGAAAYVGEGTEQFDLNGKMLMPGLMTGHEHSVASLWLAYGVSLTNASSTA